MKIGKEGKRKLKASLTNIALFLSIFVVLFPLALSTVSAEPDLIIYVDDDFESEDDTHKKTIQGGVDAAYESGAVEPLVRVYNGTYKEKVSIYSTLTLEGNHSSNTTIDADHTGTVITISAPWVNVTGFTVQNGNYGVYITNNSFDGGFSHHVKTYENNIINNSWGIYITGEPYVSYDNSIINNIINLSKYSGIVLGGKNNIVSHNIITNNTQEQTSSQKWRQAGILVSGNNNSITYNNCSYNYNYSGITVTGGSLIGNNIYHNNITNNPTGINLFGSSNNIIFDNNITDNNIGIGSVGSAAGSNNNIINKNNITHNSNGLFFGLWNGLFSHNETILENHIENNSMDGIHIEDAKDFNINDNNYFNNNGDDGLSIEASSNIDVIDNNFFNNSQTGIRVYSSNDIVLAHSTISVDIHGIYIKQSNNIRINDSAISNNSGSCIYIENSENSYIYDNPLLGYSINGVYLSNSNNVDISNSFITNNTFGIRFEHSNYNEITLNNRIFNNSISGIYLNGSLGSHNNTISNNEISINNNGITLSNSTNNSIISNDIKLNSRYGISLQNSKDNYLHNNIANNNTIYGLYIEDEYRNNITENNTFNGGNISYVSCENGNSTSLNNSIQNKVLTSGDKVTNVGKISFIECSYFNVTNNTISNATKGIFLYNSNNITLDNNIIYDIGEYGLFIEGDYRNTITNNTIVNGERVYYYYNQTGNESDPIVIEIPESERPMNATKVSNVGKISVIDSKYMLLRNNNVSYGYFGIFLYGSEELTLWNNTIIDSMDVGLNITMGYNHNISDNNRVRGYYKKWDNIYYFRDEHDMTYENYILTARNITNVGKLSFVNCTNITVNNNTLASSVYKGDEKRWVGGYGIFLYSSRNFTITDNELLGNIYSVGVIKSEENNITNCSIGNVNGILFDNANKNSVYNNTFTHYVASSIGIRITGSNNITISNNTMSSPHQQGSRGIQFTEAENINILHNTFRNKQVGILGSYSNVKIEDNFITNVTNAITGLAGCDNSTKIRNNNITNITGMGAIYIGVADTSSPAIEGNTISNARVDGIDAYHHNSSPYIYNNTIFNCGLMGIQLEDSNAVISNNKIYDVNQGINVNFQPKTLAKETYSNTIIINNEIWDCTKKPVANVWGDGILVSVYNRAYIYNNTIYDCQDYGIHAREFSFLNVSNNNVSFNKIGIRFETYEIDLKILNNTLIGNSWQGIYTQNSDESLIIDNNTFMNNNDGILTSNSDALITNNTFLSNQNGIYVVNGLVA